MSSMLRNVVDCGIQDSQYRMAIATASQQLLSDIAPVSSPEETALIVPAMRSPFPRLLSRRTPFRAIYVLDSEGEHVRWQETNLEGKEACVLRLGDERTFTGVQDVGLVLNPFGLQHYPERSKDFGKRVRKVTHDRALLVTLDWGVTTYPQDLRDFPGISNEIAHSERLQLPPFGPQDGWEQVKEIEFTFFVRHTLDEIAALLSADHARRLREEFGTDRTVDVGSSILYRLYEAR